MGNPTYGSQVAGASGGTRGANQPLVVIFERDESVAASLLGQFRAQGYECRSARTPVEVFNDIAHYPVELVLVNLGHPATSRREFWVPLDTYRRGKGIQVVTYRVSAPGVDSASPDGSGRGALADVEIRGSQGFGALVEAVRLRLSPPRQPSGSSFLLGSGPLGRGGESKPGAASFPGRSGMPSEPSPDFGSRSQIAGVLNLSAGAPPGQLPEFAPLPGPSTASGSPPGRAWPPEPTAMLFESAMQAATSAQNQRDSQWPTRYPDLSGNASEVSVSGRPGTSMRPATPESNGANSAGAMPLQSGAPPEADNFRQAALNPAMPMGEFAALSDAIHALAAAGAPGYRSAAAAVSAMSAAGMPGGNPMNPAPGMNPASVADAPMNSANMPANASNLAGGPGNPISVGRMPDPPMSAASMPNNPMNTMAHAPGASTNMGGHPMNMAPQPASAFNAANMPGDDAARRFGEQRYLTPDMPPALGGRGAPGGANPFASLASMNDGPQPADSAGGDYVRGNGNQSSAKGAAETLYMSYQAFADMRSPEASQHTRSRSLPSDNEELELLRRQRATPSWSQGDESTSPELRRPSGGMESALAGNGVDAHQRQMLSPIIAPGRAERSLSNVLIEGQLVSQQRLEVTLGIQRLLRGVDMDYRLGELLLMFKFLTPDQLLAALLVSRGLVTPAQVASMGRIKQELHAIGMEYDLENLLILFRLLSSEQLREIRSEFP